MDYSQLSDAEIAQKVWFWWNQNIRHDNTLCGMSDGKMLYVKNNVWTVFDPCNNPVDAWPIIEKQLIRIVPVVIGEKTQWVCSRDIHASASEKPLRAAMTVFLMMQGAKHD